MVMFIIKLNGEYYAGPCQFCNDVINAIHFMEHDIAMYIAGIYGAEVWFRLD